MFYLLPCLGNRCCPQNEEAQEDAVERKWTKLEVTGLLLDITLIVGLCIVASLTICVHSGVPLGPLNALSVINIPALSALWGGAMIITIIDIVKGSRCLDPKRPQLILQQPQDPQQDTGPKPTGCGHKEPTGKPNPKPKRKESGLSTNQGGNAPPTTQGQEPQPGTGDGTELKNSPPVLTEDQKPLAEEPANQGNRGQQNEVPQPAQDPNPQKTENPLPNPQALPDPKPLAEEPAPAENKDLQDEVPQPLLEPNQPVLDPVPYEEPKPLAEKPAEVVLQPEPNPEPAQVLNPPHEQQPIHQPEPNPAGQPQAAQQPNLPGADGTANPVIVPILDQQPQEAEPKIEKPPAIPVEVLQPLPEPEQKPQALIEQPELSPALDLQVPPQNNLPLPEADAFEAEAKQEPQSPGIDVKDPSGQSEEPQPLSHLQNSTPIRFLGEMMDLSSRSAKAPSNSPSPRLVLKTENKEPLVPIEPPQKSVNKNKQPIEIPVAVLVEDNYDLEASIVQFMQEEQEPSLDDLFGDSRIFDMEKPQFIAPPVPQKPSALVEQPEGMWGHMGALMNLGAQGLTYGLQGLQAVVGGMLSFASSFKKPGNVQTRFYKAQIDFIIKQFIGYSENSSQILKYQFRSFEGKINALRAKKFVDQKLGDLKVKVLTIIKDNADDLPAMKYYLLCEIETAYFENRKAYDRDTSMEEGATKEYSEPLDLFLKKLCYELFAGFDALQYGRTAMRSLLPKPSQPLTFGNIAALIREDQKSLKSLRSDQVGTFIHDQQGRARGAVGVAFYPLLENNFANFLWEESYTNGHTVKVIRFGTPTSQDAVGNVSILGQMHAFMRECESKDETLVCFEHQALEGADGARAKKMFNLANHVYSKNFSCIHLDMDSKFFKQKRVGIDIDTKGVGILQPIDAFKADLVNHVLMLPKSDNLETFNKASRKDLGNLADKVQKDHFAGKTQLTREERQDFIVEYYVEYRKYIHSCLKPTFSFDKCKDTQDRSMSILNLAYLKNQMELGKHNDPQTLADFRVLCAFVGLIVKGSPMDHERFMRFITVLERWTTQEVPKVETLLTNQVIKASTDLEYTYKTLPCDAVTQEEYLDSDLLNKKDVVLVGVILKTDKDPHTRAKELISRLYANPKAQATLILFQFDTTGKAVVNVSVRKNLQGSVGFSGNCWIEVGTNKLYVQLTDKVHR